LVKEIAIAQVQLLAHQQVLHERQGLQRIAAVTLQARNDFLLPLDEEIAVGRVPSGMFHTRFD
jgi:hypothetical protein